MDSGKSFSDALANAMRANFNAYDTRAAIEAMTGSRAAADAAIYMASHGWMSEDDFEPFLRTALVSRVRRRYDQIFGRGSLRERAQGEKAAVRAEAEAALDRDRVMESYMEDPDDSEATNAARSRLRNAPEPPSIFGYLPA